MTPNPMISIEPDKPDVNIKIELSGKGEPGYTPQRGVDYWTDADKQAIVDDVKQEIGELPGGGGGDGEPGEDGGYYIPDVSEGGVLSWMPSKPDMPGVPAANIKGKDGSDADVTADNIRIALGYTPADARKVDQLSEEIVDVNADIKSITERTGGNLYNKALAQDNKIVHNNPSRYPGLDDHNGGIFSGISPVTVGTYTISQDIHWLRNVFFSDANGKAVCAYAIPANSDVMDNYGNWPSCEGKVVVEKLTNNAHKITIVDPEIAGVAWSMHGTSYWTDHTTADFEALISTAMLAKGSAVPEYSEYGKGPLGIKQSAIEGYTDLRSNVDRINHNKVMRLIKDGANLTIESPWYDETLLLTMSEHEEHGNYNFQKYVSSSGFSKGAYDDICPINYNGSYRGGGHGDDSGFAITATSHGKTTADIGSVWATADGKEWVIIKIHDANTLWVVSEYTGNPKIPFVTAAPESPMTHVSGGTNTSQIAFTDATMQLIGPHPVRLSHQIKCDGVPVLANGVYKAAAVDLVERYEAVDTIRMLDILKANVPNNTNTSYCSDELPGELMYEVTYHFASNGSCTVSTSLTALRDDIWVSYAGLVQAQQYAPTAYVPFTQYSTPYVQPDGEAISLIPTTWDNATFPPYKYYQINQAAGYGFALGYDISSGQGVPDKRFAMMGENGAYAGTYNNKTKKMYPAFYSGNKTIEMKAGDVISANAFRLPVKFENGAIQYWWDSGDCVIAEIEVFTAGQYAIVLPDKCIGRGIETIKADDTIKVSTGGVVASNNIVVIATGAGSATVKVTH